MTRSRMRFFVAVVFLTLAVCSLVEAAKKNRRNAEDHRKDGFVKHRKSNFRDKEKIQKKWREEAPVEEISDEAGRIGIGKKARTLKVETASRLKAGRKAVEDFQSVTFAEKGKKYISGKVNRVGDNYPEDQNELSQDYEEIQQWEVERCNMVDADEETENWEEEGGDEEEMEENPEEEFVKRQRCILNKPKLKKERRASRERELLAEETGEKCYYLA